MREAPLRARRAQNAKNARVPGPRRSAKRRTALALVVAALGVGTTVLLAQAAVSGSPPKKGEAMPMRLRSPDFEHEGKIPKRFTCEGEDVSPTLDWEGVPANAKSLALIVEDPDAPDPKAPQRIWVHWVLYDIPPGAKRIPQAAGSNRLPPGTREGKNDWGRAGWGGPCPPIGRHRYFFKLYALDAALGDLGTPTKAELLAAMKHHVVAEAELMGTYRKGD